MKLILIVAALVMPSCVPPSAAAEATLTACHGLAVAAANSRAEAECPLSEKWADCSAAADIESELAASLEAC